MNGASFLPPRAWSWQLPAGKHLSPFSHVTGAKTVEIEKQILDGTSLFCIMSWCDSVEGEVKRYTRQHNLNVTMITITKIMICNGLDSWSCLAPFCTLACDAYDMNKSWSISCFLIRDVDHFCADLSTPQQLVCGSTHTHTCCRHETSLQEHRVTHIFSPTTHQNVTAQSIPSLR